MMISKSDILFYGPSFCRFQCLRIVFFSSFQNGALNKQKHDFPKNMSFDYTILKNIINSILNFELLCFFSRNLCSFPIKSLNHGDVFFPLRPSPMMMNPMMGMMAGMASMATMAKAMAKARSGNFKGGFFGAGCVVYMNLFLSW